MLLSLFGLLHSFCPIFYKVPAPWMVGGYPRLSTQCYLHSVFWPVLCITHYPRKKKLLWPKQRAAQIYTYKQKCLGSFLAAQAFSKTTADSTKGPVISPVRGFSAALNPSCYARLISNHKVTGCSYNHRATIVSMGTSCQHVSIEICSIQH